MNIQKTRDQVKIRIGALCGALLAFAMACNLPNPGSGTPTATPVPPPHPADWICHQNSTYQFEICYPPDATIAVADAEHIRIDLPVTPGTTLSEKWVDVYSRISPLSCVSPQDESAPPGSFSPESLWISGLHYTVEHAEEGAAGNIYRWKAYSTARDDVCVTMTGTLHSANPAVFSTPPPDYDQIAESAVIESIVATFRWLDLTSGWSCYQNDTYSFEFCYPPDATLVNETPEHVRINLTIHGGTNLVEKWMDVDARTGLSVCSSPQGAGYGPGVIDTETRTINTLSFLVENASDSGMGNHYVWTGYSTSRDPVCVSLTGVLHSVNPGVYETPPPEYNPVVESAVFEQIVATFRWLDLAGPTPTTPPANQPSAVMQTNNNCRRGPLLDYEIRTYLKQGVSVPIDGQTADGAWLWVRLPRSLEHCWVWSGGVKTQGDLSKVPLETAPPLGCWVSSTILTAKTAINKCIVPCPENAKPGGVCTP
jgi:hypothetical protein